jgi:hypothetical protein
VNIKLFIEACNNLDFEKFNIFINKYKINIYFINFISSNINIKKLFYITLLFYINNKSLYKDIEHMDIESKIFFISQYKIRSKDIIIKSTIPTFYINNIDKNIIIGISFLRLYNINCSTLERNNLISKKFNNFEIKIEDKIFTRRKDKSIIIFTKKIDISGITDRVIKNEEIIIALESFKNKTQFKNYDEKDFKNLLTGVIISRAKGNFTIQDVFTFLINIELFEINEKTIGILLKALGRYILLLTDHKILDKKSIIIHRSDKNKKIIYTSFIEFRIKNEKIINLINRFSEYNLLNNISHTKENLRKIRYFNQRKDISEILERQ